LIAHAYTESGVTAIQLFRFYCPYSHRISVPKLFHREKIAMHYLLSG